MAVNEGLDTQLLFCFLKKRLHDEKILAVDSVGVKNAASEGENYVSLVYRVKMRCLTSQGKRTNVSIIVKTELQGKGKKEVMESFPVFAVETRVYTTILPMMEELSEDVGDKREKLWPSLLGYQPYNMIAFEDLSEKGYTVAERRNCLDFNHCKLVLRNLARFHALGKIILDKGLITADSRGRLEIAIDNSTMHSWWDIMYTVLPDAMVNDWGDDWKRLGEKVRNQRSSVIPELGSLAENYDKRFEVFNHGDLWTCNILFKYLEFEEDVPVSVKFIDYQMGHANSFVWDLVYFIIGSAEPNMRRLQLNVLLEVYHGALEKNLNILKYDGYIPTLDDVKSEWKRVEFAQMCCCIYHCIMAADTKKAFDMEKMLTHKPEDVMDKAVFSCGKALKAIGPDIERLAREGVI